MITRADIAELRRLLEEREAAWRRVRDIDAEAPGPTKSSRLWDAQQLAQRINWQVDDKLGPLLPDLLRLADERLAESGGAITLREVSALASDCHARVADGLACGVCRLCEIWLLIDERHHIAMEGERDVSTERRPPSPLMCTCGRPLGGPCPVHGEEET